MTATPSYFTDKIQKEAEQLDFEIASMDDTSKFGKVFHLLSFSDAIKQDLLCDYRVVIIGVDDDTYRSYAEYGRFVTIDGKKITDARTLASQIAIAKVMHKYNLRRIISFHSRIKRAKEFSKQLPDVVRWMPEESRPTGKLWSEHVSGEMTSSRRDVLLNRFRHLDDGECGLLTNARCLGEGVDIPTLDGVAFIDPRNSQIDIVQAVGRAIRKAHDKKIGTVVLPVFIETEQDAETTLDSSIFKPVWNVLKALRAHDEVLGETLDQLRRQLGRYGSKGLFLPQKLFLDLPITVGKSFAESFVAKLVGRSTSSWEFWFGLLQSYTESKGDAIVPQPYITDDGYRLGKWINSERIKYRRGKLSLKHQRAFEELPGWVWTPRDNYWPEGFVNLRKYVECKGDALVPYHHITKSGYRLGKWVVKQRARYNKGKLPMERQQALEKLPGWTWDRYENIWTECLKHLVNYVKHEGNANVPLKYVTKDGYTLGNWVRMQRNNYRNKILTKDQQRTLEQLPGWTWVPHKDKWQKGYEFLRKYLGCNRNIYPNRTYVAVEGYPLGSWLHRQRTDIRRGKLPLERKSLLEQLPDWVSDPHECKWQKGFGKLCEFVQNLGHARVKSDYLTLDGFKLGKWVIERRQEYRCGELSAERQKALEQLPGWGWRSPNKPKWSEVFERLREYVELEGHARVSASYVTADGCTLGRWVSSQRKAYHQGKLSAERQKALEQIPGWA